MIYRFGFAEAEKFCTGLKSFHHLKGGFLDGCSGAQIPMVIAGKKVQPVASLAWMILDLGRDAYKALCSVPFHI